MTEPTYTLTRYQVKSVWKWFVVVFSGLLALTAFVIWLQQLFKPGFQFILWFVAWAYLGDYTMDKVDGKR